MDIRQLLIAEEPPPPQPRSFWVVRLLITGLFAGVAAAAQIIDFPINSELLKAFHLSASPAHPDKPPDVIGPNQLGDARPRGASSSNESPQATRFASAFPSLDSRFDAITLNDADDNAKLDALHRGVKLDAFHRGGELDSLPWGVIVVVVLCPALVLIFRRKGSAAWWACARTAIANRPARELRRQPRRHTRFRRGKLFDVESRSWLECTICDRSKRGARIRLEQPLKAFYSFRLFVDEAEQMTYEARVAWCRGNEAGLEFRKSYPVPTRSKLSAQRA